MESLPRRAPRRARGRCAPTAPTSGRPPSRGAPSRPSRGGSANTANARRSARGERLGRGLVEQEAGVVVDGVGEPAGAPRDGHGAVAHGDQLAEAARLEPARHAEDVAAAVDLLGEAGVEADAHGDPVGVRGGELAEAGLELGVAGAEHDQPRAVGQQRGRRGEQQVEALLVEQPRHDADHRAVAGEAHQRAQRLAGGPARRRDRTRRTARSGRGRSSGSNRSTSMPFTMPRTPRADSRPSRP